MKKYIFGLFLTFVGAMNIVVTAKNGHSIVIGLFLVIVGIAILIYTYFREKKNN